MIAKLEKRGPKFAKYIRMLKSGVSVGGVEVSMKLAGDSLDAQAPSTAQPASAVTTSKKSGAVTPANQGKMKLVSEKSNSNQQVNDFKSFFIAAIALLFVGMFLGIWKR